MNKYPYNLSHSFICLFGGITFLWKCSIISPLLHLRHQHSTNLQSYDTYSLWPYCINHTHFVVSVILQNRHHCSYLIQMSNGETGRKRGTWTERNELMTELQKKLQWLISCASIMAYFKGHDCFPERMCRWSYQMHMNYIISRVIQQKISLNGSWILMTDRGQLNDEKRIGRSRL